MYRFPWGVTFYGEWVDDDANGEGVVVDSKGETICEGIVVNNWMKHRGNHLL